MAKATGDEMFTIVEGLGLKIDYFHRLNYRPL